MFLLTNPDLHHGLLAVRVSAMLSALGLRSPHRRRQTHVLANRWPQEPVTPVSAPPVTSKQLRKWIGPVALGLILLVIPAPSGLSATAWHYFALFAAVIAGLITEPLPGAAIGLIGVTIAAALLLVGKNPAEATKWALSGFSNDAVWLIFAAHMFALGYEATGLGRRVALLLVRTLGRRTLGLGYAIALSDLCLAPVMPSNTARSGGTVYPIVKNIPPLYGSFPNNNPRRIGGYLLWTGFATTCVTSSMFLTALAPNLLAVEIARKVAHVDISWGTWALGFLPVGIPLFAATPLLCLFPLSAGDQAWRRSRTLGWRRTHHHGTDHPE
jgi:L-tartrate/succinate antiporter